MPLRRRFRHKQAEGHVEGHGRVEAGHHRNLFHSQMRILFHQVQGILDPVPVDELPEVFPGIVVYCLLFFNNFYI